MAMRTWITKILSCCSSADKRNAVPKLSKSWALELWGKPLPLLTSE